MLRIVRNLLHPIAQLRRMNTKVFRGPGIRHATVLDQSNRLKLELSRKLPPLHDAPPAPSKHQTRCLRNRVQAIVTDTKKVRSNGTTIWPCLLVSIVSKSVSMK